MEPISSFMGLAAMFTPPSVQYKKGLITRPFQKYPDSGWQPVFTAITPAPVTRATPAHPAHDHYWMDSPAPARSRECGLAPAP